jgi:hypothetical protein
MWLLKHSHKKKIASSLEQLIYNFQKLEVLTKNLSISKFDIKASLIPPLTVSNTPNEHTLEYFSMHHIKGCEYISKFYALL